MSARGGHVQVTGEGPGGENSPSFSNSRILLSFFLVVVLCPPVALHPCNPPCSLAPVVVQKPGQFFAFVLHVLQREDREEEEEKEKDKTLKMKMEEAGRIEIRTAVCRTICILFLYERFKQRTDMDDVQIRIISACISVRCEHQHI